MADVAARDLHIRAARERSGLRGILRRKSTIAFLFALPLITVILALVFIRPAMRFIWRR